MQKQFVVPGPPPPPVFGVFGTKMQFFRDPLGRMLSLYRDYGTLVQPGGPGGMVFAFGPEHNQRLLSDTTLFYNPDLTRICPEGSSLHRLWTGLVNMNGERHKQNRRRMMPAFQRKRVESYQELMHEVIEHSTAHWKAGEVRDLSHEMMLLTLRVVMRALFGIDDFDEMDRVGELLKRWLGLYASAPVHLFPHDVPLTPFRTLLRLSEQVEAEIRDIIARRRRLGPGQDVLSVLMSATDEEGGSLTEQELFGHIALLYVAGHETSANALTWTFFLLEQHPEVLADVVDELQSVLQGQHPTVESLPKLPLLDRVIKESLRLLPPVPFSSRRGMAAFELGGVELPEGTVVRYSPFITHRMPELYEQPNRFLPSRWETLEPSPYAYLPFAAGPRMCIGYSFAMQEIGLTLASLLPRFRFERVPGHRVDRKVLATFSPKHGLPMVLHAQDRAFRRTPLEGDVAELLER
jgi:cytochrome P450